MPTSVDRRFRGFRPLSLGVPLSVAHAAVFRGPGAGGGVDRASGPAVRQGGSYAGAMAERKRVIVNGIVQGVFYRDTCRQMAERHGVAGWVRNLPDGGVEAVFEGEPEAVARLVTWTRQGPPAARVDHVEAHDETPEGLTGFEVLTTPYR